MDSMTGQEVLARDSQDGANQGVAGRAPGGAGPELGAGVRGRKLSCSLGFFSAFRGVPDEDDIFHFFRLLPREKLRKVLRESFPASVRRLPSEILESPECFRQVFYDQDLEWKKIYFRVRRFLSEAFRRELRSCSSQDHEILVRVDELVRIFSLGKVGREFLILRFLYDTDPLMEYMYDTLDHGIPGFRGNMVKFAKHFATLTGIPRSDFLRELKPEGLLRSSGLVDTDGDLSENLRSFLEGLQDTALDEAYFDRDGGTELALEDLVLEGRDRSMLLRLLEGKEKAQPLNILLHGAPGTGKTELAKCLAAASGRKFHSIRAGEGRRSDGARIQALSASDSLLDPERDLVVVDEADGLLNLGEGFMNKAILNRFLERSVLPHLWITNHTGGIEESTLRRFDFALEFEPFDDKAREQVWTYLVKKRPELRSVLPVEEIKECARRFPVNAGGISYALRNLQLPEDGSDAGGCRVQEARDRLHHLLESHCKAIGVEAKKRSRASREAPYGIEGLNVDVDLPALLQRLRGFFTALERDSAEAPLIPNYNVLLHGLPGTGKTAFVRWVARELGRELVVKGGSDLLSMWVGGTEEKVRSAFTQAEKKGAILFIDEADGLFFDRQHAVRGFEANQVNELLRCMEQFEGVLFCATNHKDSMDRASLRRFAAKAEFKALEAEGRRTFFERYFGEGLHEAGLAAGLAAMDRLEGLVAADFWSAFRAFAFDTEPPALEEIVSELSGELESRDPSRGRIMGFGQ